MFVGTAAAGTSTCAKTELPVVGLTPSPIICTNVVRGRGDAWMARQCARTTYGSEPGRCDGSAIDRSMAKSPKMAIEASDSGESGIAAEDPPADPGDRTLTVPAHVSA